MHDFHFNLEPELDVHRLQLLRDPAGGALCVAVVRAPSSEAGLTAAQFTIVAAIGRRPGVQMADLADAMVMDRTTLVRALKPLQRDGIVDAAPESSGTRAVGFA